MQRMVLHPEACTLVRERNLCSRSYEFDQTPTLRSAVIGHRFVWELGYEREGGGMSGLTSVSKQPGAHASVFDLASAKLAGALFHGQHVAHGINKRK